MSTTRSQKGRKTQREAEDNVSEGFISPINVENSRFLNQDTDVVGPSRPKSPWVENSFLESLRASLKEEITSEIKNVLLEFQKEMLKLLKPETGENVRDSTVEETENETRNFYTPTKIVRINSTQNNDPDTSRNTYKGKVVHTFLPSTADDISFLLFFFKSVLQGWYLRFKMLLHSVLINTF